MSYTAYDYTNAPEDQTYIYTTDPNYTFNGPSINFDSMSTNNVVYSTVSVPVYKVNWDSNDYSSDLLTYTNPIQTINNNHKVQHIKPEETKSCCPLSAIDIVAICAISLFAVAIVALALTISPLIAIGLAALPIVIPTYVGCRMYCCQNDDDDDSESQQDLMNKIDLANHSAIFQTNSPVDDLQPVYTRTNGY